MNLRLVLLGSDTFAHPLRRLGHEALTCGSQGDLPLADPDPEWAALDKLLKKRGFQADALLVTDDVGNRKLPSGIAQAPVITAFYGVDSPLNEFWQQPYARLFDLAWLDQPRPAERLAARHAAAAWLPVGVEPELYAQPRVEAETPGVCFVGVVNQRVRPKRSAILEKISKLAPLAVRGGRQEAWFPTQEAAKLYARQQITLNENLFPGFTTRPLEVMASGGCLLSEAAPGAMDGAFKEFEHLCYFGPDDLADKLNLLLKDDGLRQRLRRQGRELVCQEHGLIQRAEVIVSKIEGMMQRAPERPRAAGGEALRLEGEALLMAGLRWPAKAGARRVLRGAARLRAAAADGARPLPASRAAGLAELSLGRAREALAHLGRARELGGAREGLMYALAAWQAGESGEFSASCQALGLAGQPGESGFHLQAARLLAEAGHGASIGFNLGGLPPSLWSALEHLLEATRLDAGHGAAWETLGDLLMAQGAPNQAAQAYDRACGLEKRDELAAKRQEAARKGFML
ncbi:hypothetical protein AAU61_05370 [Desulfocarbo indianensis]|nr:hypothetical protein AAU61_05370 [Desulfocarbo indianensis]